MHTYLIEMLECPVCHGQLSWTLLEHTGDRVERGEARCSTCACVYPVREGIGLFLAPERRREDLWEQESRQIRYVREHPEIERPLLEAPVDTLAPADRFFRALVLEERGRFAEAEAAMASAREGLYTPESRTCLSSQFDTVVERLPASRGPIVDLASGRCYLVGELLRRLERPIVATDVSLPVLRRDRRWFEYLGLYDRLSLLAFDARRTPFKDGVVSTLTTFVGLPSVAEPGNLLWELRRVVSETFLAVSVFYSEEDEVHASVIRKAGLDTVLFRSAALGAFSEAGWHVEVANACLAKTRPTPVGVLLKGFEVDGFPIAETTQELCVLVAR